jgi:malonate-semialdehyde dehydrogenase (acetylating) / methylmalonate-semialdehyde dehydrogenase
MPDADQDRAIETVISSAFGNVGERCLARSVVVAVGEANQTVVSRVIEQARELRVGSGLDEATEMGPVFRAEHRARIEHYIEAEVSEGANLALDGREGRDEIGDRGRDISRGRASSQASSRR